MATGLRQRMRGWTSLHVVAADPSELQKLEEELKNNAVNVNQQSLYRETPLILACRYKSEEAINPAVDLLLRYGADANISDQKGRTPLMHAARKGNLYVVSTLLNSAHADPDLADRSGQNAMLIAALLDNWAIVDCLLQAGASALAQNQEMRVTPVSLAVNDGQSGCLEKLLQLAVEKGQKEVIDLPNMDNVTPLMHAAREGHIECLQLLLKYGADPTLTSYISDVPGSSTALHFAIEHGHTECVQQLLEKMDILQLVHQQAGTFHICPLQLAVQVRNYESLKMLLKVGFPVNNLQRIPRPEMEKMLYRHFYFYSNLPSYYYSVLLSYYQTSLSFAAAIGDVDSVKILLDCGASVNPVSFNIDRGNGVEQQFSVHPALSALCCQKWKALDLLIEHGCDVSYQPTGISPLECLLLSFDDFNSTKKLLVRGSDPNLIFQHEKGASRSILHHLNIFNQFAGQDKFLQIFELLLQFTAIGGPVQRFFHDVLKFVTPRNPEASVYTCYSERMKAILRQVTTPSSLQNLCRIKIRQSVMSVNGYTSFIPAIHRICLPEMLKEYLLYCDLKKQSASTHD